ncbi:RNA-binding protein 4.1-like [Salarias fasciatus]|uniref:RNA-binding protein 4.1-like n=1 Tax=Salarias fasciatus TaxID=181472 RepID=UPI001176E8ED|nr:RNA-binding protein 4.1-like [Salarias fasciatus]XP_029944092.1 RNA-binding protein 4.1-like [Salarias fasciatus]
MVKIFIGNLACNTTAEELRELFEKYGNVTECDIVKNYGFVHMSNMSEAEEAIQNLNQQQLNGWRMNVEMSKGRPKSTTKLHVSNLGEGVTSEVLRAKFEEFGPVMECDIVKDYAFVHMERMDDAMEAISKMDNTAFKGKLMSVQLSTSRLRTAPGMGDHTGCFVCGRRGHWSKDCPLRDDSYGDGQRGRGGRGPPRAPPTYSTYGVASPPAAAADYMQSSAYTRSTYMGGLQPPPPPPRVGGYSAEAAGYYSSRAAAPATDRAAYDRLYGSDSYYERYRAYYGSSYFEDRRAAYMPPPPMPPSSLSKISSSADPYSRRAPPPPATAAAPAASMYYAQDHSGVRRIPATPTSYSYEQASSTSAASTGSYAVSQSKDHYTPRYAPY